MTAPRKPKAPKAPKKAKVQLKGALAAGSASPVELAAPRARARSARKPKPVGRPSRVAAALDAFELAVEQLQRDGVSSPSLCDYNLGTLEIAAQAWGRVRYHIEKRPGAVKPRELERQSTLGRRYISLRDQLVSTCFCDAAKPKKASD